MSSGWQSQSRDGDDEVLVNSNYSVGRTDFKFIDHTSREGDKGPHVAIDEYGNTVYERDAEVDEDENEDNG